jgi:transmembrane sensor
MIKEMDDSEMLLHKYNRGLCTAEEKAVVETWFLQWKEEGEPLSEQQIERINAEAWDAILGAETKARKVNWPLRITAIAAVIAMLVGVWTLLSVQTPKPPEYASNIGPGTNKATLTLADGKTINLSEAKTGIVIQEDQFSYNDGTLISKNSGGKGSGLSTISTPIGGEYQIVLSDGTKVWLNAATALQYPAVFGEQTERKVTLVSGEAYFEVRKDKKRPFIVKTTAQEIKVLGTHFNVKAYQDEPTTKTTLLEGSVAVTYTEKGNRKNFVVLKPNQQSTLANHIIGVVEVNTDEAVAWKNGEFAFRRESLASIMKKLERWYNIEVVFQDNNVSALLFGGTISKYSKVSDVLCILERTGDVKFKIEGRRVLAGK